MPSVVLFIQPAVDRRETLVSALRDRGLEVVGVADVDGALEAADSAPVGAVLVDPAVLVAEEFEIQGRIGVRCGRDVPIVAFANLADPARKAAFVRHGAVLLDRPPEDLEALAAALTRHVAASAKAPLRPTPSQLGRVKIDRLGTAEEEPLEAPVKKDGKAPFVLIVDDEEDCRELFAKILEAKGYQVHTVASATGALRFLSRGERPDLIVSDINMPVMDGFELKQMVDQQGGEPIPFIAVAAMDNGERRQTAKKLGLAAFVPKPIQVRAFCKIVRGSLEAAIAASP